MSAQEEPTHQAKVRGEERVAGAVGLFGVCFGVGQAVQASNGNLSPPAILWLTFALAAALAVLAQGALAPRTGISGRAALVLAGMGVLWEFAQLLSTWPGISLRLPNKQAFQPFYAGLAVAAVLAGAGLSSAPWLGRLRPWLLLAAFLSVGRWLLWASPAPHIDVFVFQRDGAEALLQGHNPYALRYPDIHGNPSFYGPGLSVNGQLQFGFPYFPLGLVMTLPAHLATGDFRWTQLIAMAFTGWVIMSIRPSPLARAAGALFLFSPRTFFVLEQGWTEPLAVALLALVALVAARRPTWLPWAVGLLIAVKQYTVFMVPLALLVIPRAQWLSLRALFAFAWRAATPGVAVAVPFVLWSPRDFWFDVVQLQTLQPFRDDALSLLAWWKHQYGVQPSLVLPFAVTAAVMAVSLWRLPRNSCGFLAGVTVTYLTFFATNKQAFCNYYYLIIGASALALALAASPESEGKSA